MEPFTKVTGAAAPMPVENVTTDAITPSAAGKSLATDLGKTLFNNFRYHPDGTEKPEFILNQPRFRASKFIVAGPNFGCGSSRERAVWSLMKFGIRAVIAPSFGDIFRDNSLQNGLLPVELPAAECAALIKSLEAAASPELTVDLETSAVIDLDGRRIPFSISAERRSALLQGHDEVDVILTMERDIDAYQARERLARPWVFPVIAGSQSGS